MNNPLDIARRFDILLQTAEDNTIKKIINALAVSYQRLEQDLRKSYSKYAIDSLPNMTGMQRSALLLQEIGSLLNLIPPEVQRTLDPVTLALLTRSFQAGNSLAGALLLNFDKSTLVFTPSVPLIAVEEAAKNTMLWLTGASGAFRATASAVVQQGLVQNQGVDWTSGVLRRTLGVTKRDAISIVRTASLQATDSAARQVYEANNIKYVQRAATEDERVCGYCAARAGNIYRLEETVAILHVRCRCYLMPVDPKWIALGLDDLGWAQTHSQNVRATSTTTLNTGLSHLERSAGLVTPPQPVWSPAEGFLDNRFQRACQAPF